MGLMTERPLPVAELLPTPSEIRIVGELDSWMETEGDPEILGATWIDSSQAYNFSLHSKDATAVTLLLYSDENLASPLKSYDLQFPKNKTNRIWHILIPWAEITGAKYYGYRVDGPFNPARGQRFDKQKILLDPYARQIFFPPNFDRNAAILPGDNEGKAPLAILPPRRNPPLMRLVGSRSTRHTHDLIIYEMHVRQFTKDRSSGLDDKTRGTYAGVIEKIPYLKELGITAVELMPVHQYDLADGNGWGYMTLGFFAPHCAYARNADPETAPDEFREMVEALHRADIEVILDVVYNHSAEGDERGPTYSFRGIDNSSYYALDPNDLSKHVNLSECGNDMRTSHPIVRDLIGASLRYWAMEMGVDGFRFDLASILMRGDDGRLDYLSPAIISEITTDPILRGLRLIAEPWQGEPGGGYVAGRAFAGLTWRQWNADFRDDVRHFLKGDNGFVGKLMARLYGSTDLFPDTLPEAYRPRQSVNYVDCHDGLCLYDLVSYTNDAQNSWNCGWEGDQGVPADVMTLRKRQVKNFCCLLMLANGTPMFRAGDEFLNTQQGYDNPYNQDSKIVWLDWTRYTSHQDVFRFFKTMIAFRKAHPSLGRSCFWNGDVRWYGVRRDVDLSDTSHTLAFALSGCSVGDADIYVMINAYWKDLEFTVQEGTLGQWLRVVDTGQDSPEDIFEAENEQRLPAMDVRVRSRSIVVLVRPRQSTTN